MLAYSLYSSHDIRLVGTREAKPGPLLNRGYDESERQMGGLLRRHPLPDKWALIARVTDPPYDRCSHKSKDQRTPQKGVNPPKRADGPGFTDQGMSPDHERDNNEYHIEPQYPSKPTCEAVIDGNTRSEGEPCSFVDLSITVFTEWDDR